MKANPSHPNALTTTSENPSISKAPTNIGLSDQPFGIPKTTS